MKEQLLAQLENFKTDFVALLPKLGLAVALLLVFWGLSWLFRRFLRRLLRLRLEDRLLLRFIVRSSGVVVMMVGFVLALRVLGLADIAVGLLSAAGVTAIVIGFAFKDIGENFIAGIFLAFDRPFKSGDLIQIGSQKGRVVLLNIRYTQLKTGDGKDVFVPNSSIIKGELINYTVDGYLRNEITLGIDYGSNLKQAEDIIRQVITDIPGVILDKGVSVYASGFGDSSMNLTYTYWVDLFDQQYSIVQIRSAAFQKVWTALDAAGFSLPGNILELKNYNDIPVKFAPAS